MIQNNSVLPSTLVITSAFLLPASCSCFPPFYPLICAVRHKSLRRCWTCPYTHARQEDCQSDALSYSRTNQLGATARTTTIAVRHARQQGEVLARRP